MRRRFCVSIGFVAVLAFCGFAPATTIDVTNPGFDTLVDATFTYGGNTYTAGCVMAQNMYVTTEIAGAIDNATTGEHTGGTGSTAGYAMTPAGLAGVSNYNTGVVGTDPAGCIGLLLTLGGGQTTTLAQTLPGPVSLLSNSLYTLTFDVYKRIVLPLPISFAADLTVDGSSVGGALLYTAPTDSTKGSGTVTFQTGSTPVAGSLGFVFASADTAPITQIFVDNVALTVASVPEPGTLVLVSTGLIGLLCYAWRRQR
jgi:hypothetical protein